MPPAAMEWDIITALLDNLILPPLAVAAIGDRNGRNRIGAGIQETGQNPVVDGARRRELGQPFIARLCCI